LNTVAGIAIISQASPMARESSKVTTSTAAGLVGLIAIANGTGRLLWEWFSDAVGRPGNELSQHSSYRWPTLIKRTRSV